MVNPDFSLKEAQLISLGLNKLNLHSRLKNRLVDSYTSRGLK